MSTEQKMINNFIPGNMMYASAHTVLSINSMQNTKSGPMQEFPRRLNSLDVDKLLQTLSWWPAINH